MTKDTGNTPLGPSAVADGDPALARVESVIRALVRLINGKKLYADNNPRLAQFQEGFQAELTRYFKREDELVLSIDQYSIRWHDETVYENQKREESVAFLLHKDGIGEISVYAGAVGAEMDLLVQILADEYHKVASEDDVVTRFWNADFEHITYRVLDDYLSGDNAELTRTSETDAIVPTLDHEELLPSLADKGRVIVQPADPLESIDDYLKKLILRTCPSKEETAREEYFQKMVGSFFTVGNEEIAMYRDELDREARADSLADFAETVFVFTLLQDNPSAVRDVTGVLERVVEYSVEERAPGTLSRLLALVRNFREQSRLPENVIELCDRFESRLTDPAMTDALGERLEQVTESSEETLRYFRLIGERAVDPLLRVLHHVDGKRLHRDICDTLVDISGDDVVHVLDRLDIDIAAIALDAVYIASQIEPPLLTPRLQELIYYPDRRVKEEMIALAARVGDKAAVDMLLGATADDDKNVRCRAMESLATVPDERVRGHLGELAFGRDAAERDNDEQEVLFKSLGRQGDRETVALLTRFIEKKSIVHFGRGRENKFLAIRALERIHVPEALDLLNTLARDSNSLVESRAKRAWTMLKASLDKRARGEQQ